MVCATIPVSEARVTVSGDGRSLCARRTAWTRGRTLTKKPGKGNNNNYEKRHEKKRKGSYDQIPHPETFQMPLPSAEEKAKERLPFNDCLSLFLSVFQPQQVNNTNHMVFVPPHNRRPLSPQPEYGVPSTPRLIRAAHLPPTHGNVTPTDGG